MSCHECNGKASDKCRACGRECCGKHGYVAIVDSSNESITMNSGTLCRHCHPEYRKPDCSYCHDQKTIMAINEETGVGLRKCPKCCGG